MYGTEVVMVVMVVVGKRSYAESKRMNVCKREDTDLVFVRVNREQ